MLHFYLFLQILGYDSFNNQGQGQFSIPPPNYSAPPPSGGYGSGAPGGNFGGGQGGKNYFLTLICKKLYLNYEKVVPIVL